MQMEQVRRVWDDEPSFDNGNRRMGIALKPGWARLRRMLTLRSVQRAGSDSLSEGRGKTRLWEISAVCALMLAGIGLFLFRDKVFGPPEHIVLSLRGSTSIGDELVPKLAEAFLRDEFGATETGQRVKGHDAGGHPVLHVWGKVPGKPGLQVIEIYATGSGAAFKCLSAEIGPDYCDIGMSSRPMSDSDMRLSPQGRNLEDRPAEHVVALDAIAVIVNSENPVSQLSIPQVRSIYSEEIKNWKEVGGDDAPIELYGRDSNSGTFEMFTEKVLGKNSMATARQVALPRDRQKGDSSQIVDAVMRSRNAIGYASSPLVKNVKTLSISDGSSRAFLPTELSIVTEDYPICRRLLLYDWDTPGSMENAFMRYATYKPGQAIVDQTPFAELTAKVFHVEPPKGSPVAYRKIALGYSRVGLSFHFSAANAEAAENAGNQLDNLAKINILRLRTFLSQHGGTGDDILLIGFADQVEDRVSNRRLAHQRAEGVANDLRAIGVVVPVANIRDFGADLPVASNDSPEGRSKNRRVEVWVRNGLL
jgi:phosphate transport system substrate-binding protein